MHLWPLGCVLQAAICFGGEYRLHFQVYHLQDFNDPKSVCHFMVPGVPLFLLKLYLNINTFTTLNLLCHIKLLNLKHLPRFVPSTCTR
jgi:hypothetical protein